MIFSEALPTTTVDTVSEFTRRSATGYCKWRTCPRTLGSRLKTTFPAHNCCSKRHGTCRIREAYRPYTPVWDLYWGKSRSYNNAQIAQFDYISGSIRSQVCVLGVSKVQAWGKGAVVQTLKSSIMHAVWLGEVYNRKPCKIRFAGDTWRQTQAWKTQPDMEYAWLRFQFPPTYAENIGTSCYPSKSHRYRQ